MRDRRTPRHTARHRLTAALVGAVLALSACGDDADNPLEDDEVEVQGGAVGPDVRINDDLGLQGSLRSSQSIPVTFTFAGAAEATVEVMVSAEEDDLPMPFDFPNENPETRLEAQPSTSPATPTS